MHDFAYTCPPSLADAVAMLADDPDALPLSGGQTLMPVLRARLAAPSRVVDLSRLTELKGIAFDGASLTIGAGETHAEVAAHPLVRAAVPALATLAGGIGDPMVRHRGTIGGSVANNDPAACYPSAVLALGAEIVTDRRTIPADSFFKGMFLTALEPGELVAALAFPATPIAIYSKFANPASRFALVAAFVARTPAGVRIAITGGGTGVFRWCDAEAASDTGATDPAAALLSANHFTGDLHASAEFRIELARVMTRRGLSALARPD